MSRKQSPYYLRKKRIPVFSETESDVTSRTYPGSYDDVSSYRDYEYSNARNMRNKQHSMLSVDDDERYMVKGRIYKSPKNKYFEDLIHEEPQKEYDVGKYFEKTSSHMNKKSDKYEDQRYKKHKTSHLKTKNREKDYHVYSYYEPKHNEALRGKNTLKDLPLSSEVELKTHEYPILAFRDGNSGERGSDLVYLPVIVLDKKLGNPKYEKKIQQPTHQTYHDNFQVFAANLQDQANIFQNVEGVPNVITSNKPVNEEANPKTDYGNKEMPGIQYGGSFLGSVNEEAKTGQSVLLTYKVGSGNLPNKSIGSLKSNGEKSFHLKNNSTHNPTNDGYPISKDYIKVSASDQQKKNSNTHLYGEAETKTSTQKQSTKNSQAFQIIDDEKISMSIAESNANPARKSVNKYPSRELQEDKQTGNMSLASDIRQSLSTRSKQAGASHAGPPEKVQMKEKSSNLTVFNEGRSHSFARQGSHKQESIVGSTAATSRLVATNLQSETRLFPQSSDRKTVKLENHNELRSSKLPSMQETTPSRLNNHQKSVISNQSSTGRISTVAHIAEVPSPIVRNNSKSSVHSRKSIKKLSETNLIKDEIGKSRIASSSEKARKPMAGSSANKSFEPSSPYRNSHILGEETQKLGKNNSIDALKAFTNTVFQIDLEPQKKSTPKREGKKSTESKGKPQISAVIQNLKPESKHQLRHGTQHLSTATRSPSSDSRGVKMMYQNKTVTNNTPKDEERNYRSLSRTSKVLSKAERQRSSEKLQSYIPTSSQRGSSKSEGKAHPELNTQDIGDSQFVRSIEPTVTQYKKENNNKMGALKKSKSKEDNSKPKSLTRLNSRNNSQIDNEDNDENKKKKEDKSKSNKPKSLTRLFSRNKSQPDNEASDENKKKKEDKSKSSNKSLTRLFSRNKSQPDNEANEENKKKKGEKSKSRSFLGILKRSKSSNMSVKPSAPKKTDHSPPPDGPESKKGKECDCYLKYIRNTRDCAYFFLGTTLHEQIMNIISAFVGE